MMMNRVHVGRTAWHLLVVHVCFAILPLNGACATNDAGHGEYPAALVKAAQAFRSASPTNRYAEAENVWKELPKCPTTFEKDIGTGVVRSYDYSKPSYLLSSRDVLVLLGEPFLLKTNAEARTYSYLIRGKQPHESWSLSIEFHNDRVVRSNLRGPVSHKQ